MADRDQPVIIIRKKKKGHAGHHGGAWKVAYADFVTAMMAFFLMMWLLNTTTSDQRKGIADYFAPMSVSTSFGGSGGPMGGTSITSSTGAEISSSSPPGVDNQTLATVGKGENGDEDVPGKSEKSAEGGKSDKDAPLTPAEIATKDAVQLAEAMKTEEQKFGEAEGLLKSAITQTPGLKDLADHLVIDRTPEGLRIQIIDKDGFSLFPSGSSIPYEKGQNLLRLVGRVISRLPNMISVTGHTDSSPFSPMSRRNNWDLSSERANVSRDELEAGGVRPDHIARIVGLADRDPFVANDPKDPRNRRISIVLLRQSLTATGAAPAKPSPPAEQSIPSSVKAAPAKTQP